MRCLECGNDLIPGFSECFSCGAALPKVQARANSPYHDTISRRLQNTSSSSPKSKTEVLDEYFAKDLDFSNSKKKAQMKFSSYTSYLSSPTPGSSPAYLAASSKEKMMSNGNSHSPRNQRTPYEAAAEDLPESSFYPKRRTPQKSLEEMEREILVGKEIDSIIAMGRQHADENAALRGAVVSSPSDRPKRWSKFGEENDEASSTSTKTANHLDYRNGVWNPDDQMYPWRNSRKYVKAFSSPYSSNQESSTSVTHQNQRSSNNNSFTGIVVTAGSRTPTPNDLGNNNNNPHIHISSPSTTSSSSRHQNQLQQQQQQQSSTSPTPSFSLMSAENNNHLNMMSNNSNFLPFNAHAAAFLIEMYAANLHEQMLVHRNDMLRGMSAILRERVAFEKAAEEIRQAETFAARASAIRSIESSKLSQENAELRFELEEALAAVERQKQITESVANELAEVKAMYETSQMAFQSIGSPLANQQNVF